MSLKTIRVIVSPYHVGIVDHRVGTGPRCLLAHGLVEQLRASGKEVQICEIAQVDDFEGEIGRSFEIIRRVSTAVKAAVDDGVFPIVLARNCNNTVGVVAGLSISDLEIVWFDAHADLDTPDDVKSGYFDAMGVSMLTGTSWKALLATPLSLDKVVYCGVRDLREDQSYRLKNSSARVVYGGSQVPDAGYATVLDKLLRNEEKAMSPCVVHLDVDCFDTSIGKANEYAAPGGLNEQDLLQCFEVVSSNRRPVGLTVASFSPNLEGSDCIAEVAVRAIVQLAQNV